MNPSGGPRLSVATPPTACPEPSGPLARPAPIEAERWELEIAGPLASASLALARGFAAGRRLLVRGDGPCAADARHVAVEFVHPVIVGKRALPALAPPPHRVGALERADDMILVIDRGGASAAPRATVVLADPDSALEGEHVLRVPTRDPLLARELQVTLYHLLWETVHVFLEHPEIAGRVA